ncbi:MAG: asparagine synthase (glutamine-hydrolyzing) [Oceanidesulfovibrio sp.]
MCGFTGFLGQPTPGADPLPFRRILGHMARATTHRGPDGRGELYVPETGLGLAHNRLAILDTTPAGAQPMAFHAGSAAAYDPSSSTGPHHPETSWIVFNGEIYNHQELRNALESDGCVRGWRSGCDTESLLAACACWGVETTLHRCVGMFAFAYWNGSARTLCLARDRMGVKPLVFGMVGHNAETRALLFASELTALEAHPLFPGPDALDLAALASFFSWGCVPAPSTIYSGFAKLPPGCLLTVRPEDIHAGTQPEPRQYYSVARVAVSGLATPFDDEDEAVEQIDTMLQRAVADRLLADVPLGAFFSGGTDSSLVVALMQQACDRPVRTFTLGSPHPEHDESAKAAAVAAHLGADHTNLPVSEADALALARDISSLYDEPFADSSQIPTHLVSRLARQHVTVCLSGDGGDELFGGYNRHVLGPAIWRRMDAVPFALRRLLAGLLAAGGEAALDGVYNRLAPLLPPERRQVLFRQKVAKVRRGLAAPDREAFYRTLAALWPEPPLAEQTADLPWPDRRMAAGLDSFPGAAAAMDFGDWMQAADQLGYLPDDILAKVERATMAVALEVRVPLLDHRVVELAWRLPRSLRMHRGRGKTVLRRLLARHLPADLVDQPKQGFGVPLTDWLRGPLRPWAEELLAPERLGAHGLLDAQAIHREWRRLLAGQDRSGFNASAMRIWAVCMFQAWRAERTSA